MSELQPWRTLARRLTFRTRRIAIYTETVELPDGRVVDDYEQFDMASFVIMLVQTRDGGILCERQYKHGIRRVCLTLPGGHIEEGEEPLAAAQRELLEETGYTATNWRDLGSFRTHANQGGATVTYFHATDAVPVQAPHSGDLEEMRIEVLPLPRLLEAVAAGEFQVVADLGGMLLALLPHIRD